MQTVPSVRARTRGESSHLIWPSSSWGSTVNDCRLVSRCSCTYLGQKKKKKKGGYQIGEGWVSFDKKGVVGVGVVQLVLVLLLFLFKSCANVRKFIFESARGQSVVFKNKTPFKKNHSLSLRAEEL